MKRILVVSDCPTHRPTAGNRNCILQNVKVLQSMGNEVFFLLLDKGDINDKDYEGLKKFWGDALYVTKQSKIQTLLQRLLLKFSVAFKLNNPFIDLLCPWSAEATLKHLEMKYSFDAIIVNYVWNSKLLLSSKIPSKSIYTHDVFSDRNKGGISQWHSFSPSIEAKGLSRCQHVLAIQENEALYYKSIVKGADVKTLYMPFVFHEIESKSHCDILFFSGGNEHNIKGICHFIEEVWPSIVTKYPNVRLNIGGSICKLLNEESLPESVKLKGLFDNPADFYCLGNIAINPVFSGTGLKVKTFEAISYGKIVLAHKHSLDGIYDPKSAPIIECNNTDDYLKAFDKVMNTQWNDRMVITKCRDYIERLNKYIVSQYTSIL